MRSELSLSLSPRTEQQSGAVQAHSPGKAPRRLLPGSLCLSAAGWPGSPSPSLSRVSLPSPICFQNRLGGRNGLLAGSPRPSSRTAPRSRPREGTEGAESNSRTPGHCPGRALAPRAAPAGRAPRGTKPKSGLPTPHHCARVQQHLAASCPAPSITPLPVC